MPGWSTGCRFITRPLKRCLITSQRPRSRSIIRQRRPLPTGSTRSPTSMRRGRAWPPSPAAPLRYIARSDPSRCSSMTRHGKSGCAPVARLPHSSVGLAILPLEQGFTTDSLTLLGEQDILGDRLARAPRRRRNLEDFITEAGALSSGDLVVHAEHGIGRYEGLETIDVAGAPHDCLKVLYAGDDRLFVPVENIEVLSRYGSEEAGAQLDRLGGVAWQSRKARVKQRIREIAGELIRVAAERQLRPGETLTPPEGLYAEFEARFPYPETEDQLRAIEETLGDMAAGKPMDRLICGDVGFGKTEVALRAAFITAFAGAQVAVIVPPTLLARHHSRSFSERYAGLPVRIAQLSRLDSAKEVKQAKAEIAEGRIDIVIGTHALLAKDVRFAHLGL